MGSKYTLFHGAKKRFSEFVPSTSGAEGPGIYFTDRKESAANYGSIVMECEVELRNPYYFYPSDQSFDAQVNPELLEQVLDDDDLSIVYARMEAQGVDGYGMELQNKLKGQGYDGIIMVCPWGEPTLPGVASEAVVIVFDPAQVSIKKVHKNPGPRI